MLQNNFVRFKMSTCHLNVRLSYHFFSNDSISPMAVWQLCINIEASQEGLVPLSLSLRSLSLSVSVRLVRVKSENKILSYRWKNSVGIKMKRQKDGKVDN